jgi:hypothetical protein
MIHLRTTSGIGDGSDQSEHEVRHTRERADLVEREPRGGAGRSFLEVNPYLACDVMGLIDDSDRVTGFTAHRLLRGESS